MTTTTVRKPFTLASRISLGQLDRYWQDQGDDTEREIVHAATCECCGHVGLKYASFRGPEGRLALSLCGACGDSRPV